MGRPCCFPSPYHGVCWAQARPPGAAQTPNTIKMQLEAAAPPGAGQQELLSVRMTAPPAGPAEVLP